MQLIVTLQNCRKFWSRSFVTFLVFFAQFFANLSTVMVALMAKPLMVPLFIFLLKGDTIRSNKKFPQQQLVSSPLLTSRGKDLIFVVESLRLPVLWNIRAKK